MSETSREHLQRRHAEHDAIEDLDALAEWLADEAYNWRIVADEGMQGHPEACPCRLCWTRDVKRRMRQAVRRELAREHHEEQGHR